MTSFAEACRLCLEVDQDNINIFSEEGQKRSLTQLVWKHLSIWIDDEGSLPRNICQQCIAEIEHFSCFCAKVEEVQQRINRHSTHTSKDPPEKPQPTCDSPNESILDIKIELDPFAVSDMNESNNQSDASDLSESVTCNGLDQVEDAVDPLYSEEMPGDQDERTADERTGPREVGNLSKIEILPEIKDTVDSNDALEDSETTEEGHETMDPEIKCSSIRDADLSSFYKFSCELCKNGETFDKYELLDKHCQSKHNSKGIVKCCGQEISGEYHLRRHMHKHVQPFKCQECDKEFISQWNLNRHMVSKHVPDEKRPFKCKECSKGFATKNHLQLHENHHQSHVQKLAYVCDTCGKRYSNPSVLHHHQLYQHEKKHRAMCHICAKTFPTLSTLRRHLETHEPVINRHSCPECGKELKNKDTLRSHMKLHGGKEFACPECDKVFPVAHKLRDHLRCHSSLRPYECLVCTKSFKRKIALTEHMVQHTGERPHQCPYCPRTFASRANYHTHKRRMHSSIKSGCILLESSHPDLSPTTVVNIYSGTVVIFEPKVQSIYTASCLPLPLQNLAHQCIPPLHQVIEPAALHLQRSARRIGKYLTNTVCKHLNNLNRKEEAFRKYVSQSATNSTRVVKPRPPHTASTGPVEPIPCH